MASVDWSDAALDELEEIRDYIGQDSISAAERVIARITSAVDKLEQFPDLGRILPIPDRHDIRQLFVGRYRIIYQVRAGAVRIVMVRHTARRLDDTDLIDRL